MLTIRAIRTQINQTAKLHADQIRREERGARSVLPLALSEISEYASECINIIAPYTKSVSATYPMPSKIKVPSIPDDVLDIMKANASYADDRIAESIAGTAAWLQVQHSRLERLIKKTSQGPIYNITKYEALNAVVDAAELRARCSQLFPNSRGAYSDHEETTFKERLNEAIFTAGLDDIDDPLLHALIDKRVEPTPFTLQTTSDPPP